MTFLEAAIEVLRTAEDPLHFKEIARRAVERKLLSHVGRDPNAAMQSCLNQAVRSKVHDGLVMRSKPGHYRLRAGVALPELPPPPAKPEPLPVAEEAADPTAESPKGRKKKSSKNKKKTRSSSKSDKKSSKKKTSKSSSKKTRGKSKAKAKDDEEHEDDGSSAKTKKKAKKAKKTKKTKSKKAAKTTAKKSKKGRKKTSKRASKGEAPSRDDGEDHGDDQDAPELVFDVPEGGPDSPMPMPDLDPSKVRFRGPEGSGLEEDTDVALVMANAMSRLVEDRPELREELEAMQKGQAPEPEVIEIGRKKRRDDKDDGDRDDRGGGGGGRRRRRRRRKSRRVDWSNSGSTESIESRSEELLDKVGAVLAEAGPRSLHVRQIAESLASQDVLGGDISEIERAVTAAILLDVHRRGEASRFAVRGDARYQLRGSRVPEKAAAAEYAARSAIRTLEQETEKQLLLWLQSLGARSLESLARIWLAREDYNLVATLPPSRGLGKLVVEDPDPDDDDGRTLVLIVPRKTSLEPKLWDGEAERNKCAQTMVFAMCEPINDSSIGDTRVIFAPELTRWLLRNGIGVRTIRFEVPVLDAGLIESIAGLDT